MHGNEIARQFDKSAGFRKNMIIVPGRSLKRRMPSHRGEKMKEVAMHNVKLHIEDATMEVFARIVKAEANKYDCSMDIDFQDGQRKTRFIGEPAYAQHILQDVKHIFYGRYFRDNDE